MSWALAMQASSAWEWAFQAERNFWQAFHAYGWQEDWQVWQEDEVQVPGEGMDGGKGFDGKGGEGKMGGGMDMSQGMGCGMMGGNPMMGMMMSFTSESMILLKAAPIMTPMARSTTLPRIANF